jgi:hypothetical protein
MNTPLVPDTKICAASLAFFTLFEQSQYTLRISDLTHYDKGLEKMFS